MTLSKHLSNARADEISETLCQALEKTATDAKNCLDLEPESRHKQGKHKEYQEISDSINKKSQSEDSTPQNHYKQTRKPKTAKSSTCWFCSGNKMAMKADQHLGNSVKSAYAL